jgi:hypothetical protein
VNAEAEEVARVAIENPKKYPGTLKICNHVTT